ncbi:MAG: AAA family ATPase [Anaerolineae bacterium]|nr:AAA family ATPase [Anaerolineae bacterium]
MSSFRVWLGTIWSGFGHKKMERMPDLVDQSPNLDIPVLPLDPALERVLLRVRLRARRRAAWLRKLWSEEGAPGGKSVVTHAEIDTHLADRDTPQAEIVWFASDPMMMQLNHQIAEVEKAIAADEDSPLARLSQTFGFDAQDEDLFQACLAVTLDPSIRRIYAYIQDHAGYGYPSESLVARLFDHGRYCRWGPESPLRRWELVTEREAGPDAPSMLACDASILDWLLGGTILDEYLVGIATFRPPLEPLEQWPVMEMANLLAQVINNGQDSPTRVCISGPPGSGRRTLAACISEQLGLPLLAVDADHVLEEDWPRVYLHAQRQAYVTRCALAWHGEVTLQRAWPQVIPWFPVQYAICEPGQTLPTVSGIIDQRVEMPVPSLEERRRLWLQHVPAAKDWTSEGFAKLVAQHRASVGTIVAIGKKGVQTAGDAAALVRQTGRHRLGKLAQALECPFEWEDLEVPRSLGDALEDLVFEAQARAAFWDRREARDLFPQGRGLLALFSGPPGTGKTMAAQVIARKLGLDLFRIDLSTVVSKYVGETSQNLERILSQAEHMDVVLLFDEADALFGKRTEIRDAHDRFANTDTAYLLQAIENYRGVALLATNKKGNIDPAFVRRIRYVLEFPKPDAGQRLRIWQGIVAKLMGEAQLKVLHNDLIALANGVEVTGAQIKFATLTASFSAQRDSEPLAMRHLLRGLERELMKEGRALSGRERERLLHYGE